MESLENPYIRLKIINFSYNFIYTQRFIKKKEKRKKDERNENFKEK